MYDRLGQLFMAQMIGGDMQEKCRERGFVRLMEPTAGEGGIVIAIAHALCDAGIRSRSLLH